MATERIEGGAGPELWPASRVVLGFSSGVAPFFVRRAIKRKRLLPFRCLARIFLGCLIALHSFPNADRTVFDFVDDGSSKS